MPFTPITLKSLRKKDFNFEPKTLGDHIRKQMLILGITQKDVARILGVSQASVINWEKGANIPVRMVTHRRIIEFLEYDPFPQPASLSEQIRKERQLRGWTQRQLAAYLGVWSTTIKNWEAGGTVMAIAHRRLLAKFLRLPEIDLLSIMRKQWNDNHGRTTAEHTRDCRW